MLVLLITAATGAWAQTGMTKGMFSVSETKRVYFSKGNLQLVGENTFQFAENQWDYFGSNQSDNHRDLFCWGTGNNPNQTTGNSTFTDWGDNTYLQATLGKGWRTMTKDEFVYVFNTRASGSSVFGIADGRYTTATINTDGTGVKGFILFPDGITIAASEVTTAGTINNKGTVTQCTKAQWAALAEKGCVFLPAGGFILSGSGIGHGDITDYWSSTAADASKAYNLNFNFGYPQGGVNPAGTLGYNYGCAVRLVIDGYYLTLADGTKDAAKWTASTDGTNFGALPIGGLKGDGSETVTLKYNGRLKVKGVKATSEAAAPAPASGTDLATITANYEAKDGDILTGTLGSNVKISIADGAKVTLKDVTINGVNNWSCEWAGITCEGDATITLEGTNTVKGFRGQYPGIYVPEDKTLTIEGEGSLNASGNGRSTGIGGGFYRHCGNIVINGGNITATGGNYNAGIGGGEGEEGDSYRCGSITINGGTVTATGGDGAAGIGCGYYGASNDITITGGTVMATGGENAAGIGSGEGGSCGAITISGGTVTATAVKWAAGIGGGNMNGASGTITITSGVTQVTATKGSDWLDSIGKGDGGEIITVIIEDYDKVIQN